MKRKGKIISILVAIIIFLVGCSSDKANNTDVAKEDEGKKGLTEEKLDDNFNEKESIENNVDEEELSKDEVYKKPEQNLYIEDFTPEGIKALVDSSVGIDDKITDVKIKDKDITIYVNLAESSLIEMTELAVSRYSSISDELLKYNNWNNLTVVFDGIGKVTMNSKEAILTEYNDKCFDIPEIEKRIIG